MNGSRVFMCFFILCSVQFSGGPTSTSESKASHSDSTGYVSPKSAVLAPDLGGGKAFCSFSAASFSLRCSSLVLGSSVTSFAFSFIAVSNNVAATSTPGSVFAGSILRSGTARILPVALSLVTSGAASRSKRGPFAPTGSTGPMVLTSPPTFLR